MSEKSKSLRARLSRTLNFLVPQRGLSKLRDQMAQLDQRLSNEIAALKQQAIATQVQTVAARKHSLRLENRVARPASPYALDEFFIELEKKFPTTFGIWKNAFDAGELEYRKGLATSLSIEGNPGAEQFRHFLALHAYGHVLDIGCGPQDFPSYFEGLDIERLAGIDPLPRKTQPKFEFVQAFAERLPWPSEEFDTVTIATSLDHVLSLDMTLEEVKRALRPGGSLILWVSFVPGAQPYDPLDPKLKPIDEFHLFHFDRDWFISLMLKYFILREEHAIDSQSHFYVFVKQQ